MSLRARPASSPASPSRPPRLPRSLIVVWALLVLPVLGWLVVVIGTAVGNRGTYFGPQTARTAVLFTALVLAALATTAAARRARTGGGTAALTMVTAGLLLACAAPLFLGVAAAFTEEWCEGQPGGRGGTGYHSDADVPALCR